MPNTNEERSLNTKSAIVFISFFIQLSALVWGAAKIDAAVDQLEKTVAGLAADVGTVQHLNVRLAVVEQILLNQGKTR